MKTRLICLVCFLITFCIYPRDNVVRWYTNGYVSTTLTQVYTTSGTTNWFAGGTTNTINGTGFHIPDGVRKIQIVWRFNGTNSVSTNALGGTIYFTTGTFGAGGTTPTYDDYRQSQYYLTANGYGVSTNQVSDVFDVEPCTIIRPDTLINNLGGGISNSVYDVIWKTPTKEQ